ncbi:uncharacterized protein LOC128835709 [Malaclemys terrapin pileata]|uniref:uncharacterized protein LOC128835709 n=1 Tax=Malaclemys terrapin pileata TaxID=2991368 RepID=UPI0023A7B3BF|nr:uncharacterized protein LOC128835709 [Malaclemys terrapin pileata]
MCQSPCTTLRSQINFDCFSTLVCLLAQSTPGNEPHCCCPRALCAGNSSWRPTWGSRLKFSLAWTPLRGRQIAATPDTQCAPVTLLGASAETWFGRPRRAQRARTVEKQLRATVRNRSRGEGNGEESVPWIRYTKDLQPLPLDAPVHSLQPGDSILVRTWKDEPLQEKWKGPHTVLLISHTAAKVEGHKNWIHHSRLKAVPAPERWTVQPAEKTASNDLGLKLLFR